MTERKQLIDDLAKTYPRMDFSFASPLLDCDEQPMWLRKQFGDIRYGAIILPENASDDLVQRTKCLFPNAYQARGPVLRKLN